MVSLEVLAQPLTVQILKSMPNLPVDISSGSSPDFTINFNSIADNSFRISD